MAVVGDAIMYLKSYNQWQYTSHPFQFRPSADEYTPVGMCAGFVDNHAEFVQMDDVVPFFEYNGGAFYWPNPKR